MENDKLGSDFKESITNTFKSSIIIAFLVFAWYMTNAFSSFYTKLTLVSGDTLDLPLNDETTWLRDTRLMLWISFMQLFLSGSSGLFVFYISKLNTGSNKGTSPWNYFVFNQNSLWRKNIIKIGLCNAIGTLSTNIGYIHGSVSLVQLIKAMEPVATVIGDRIIRGKTPSIDTLISVQVIIVGASAASFSDLSFNFTSVFAALIGNAVLPLRNIFATEFKASGSIEDPSCPMPTGFIMFALISTVGAVMVGALTLICEMSIFILPSSYTAQQPSVLQLVSWFSAINGSWTYTAYNSFSFMVLEQIGPIAHAVLNVFKRAFNIIAATIFFDQYISSSFMTGLTISLLGLCLYVFSEQKLDTRYPGIIKVLKPCIYMSVLVALGLLVGPTNFLYTSSGTELYAAKKILSRSTTVHSSHDIANDVRNVSHSNYSKCVLIFGAYTNGNMGDYIQPLSVISHLRSFDHNLCIYTSTPDYGHGKYNKIVTSQDYHIGNLLCDSDSADVVNQFGAFVIGGGGLLTAPHVPLVCPEFSKHLRPDLPVVFFGIGSESLDSVSSAAPLLKLATFISARDISSISVMQRVLKSNHLNKTVYHMYDPVLSDRASYSTTRKGIVSTEWKNSTSLCYVLPAQCYEPSTFNQLDPWWRYRGHEWIARLLSPKDILINVFPKYSKRVQSFYPYHKIHDIIDPDEYIATINKCRAVISMRLHGSILGMHSSVPTIPMSQKLSGKVYSLMHSVLDFPDLFFQLNSSITKSAMRQHVKYVVNEYVTNGRREKIWAKLDTLFRHAHNHIHERKNNVLPLLQLS